MGIIANPLASVIDGLLKGHALGLQMQQEKRAQQEFLTQQAMHNQQMSMQDILNQKWFQENTRPVTAMGTVESPAGPDIPNTAPGMPASPGAPAYVRKADKSRTITLPVQGNKLTGELYSPEEQEQKALTQKISGQQAIADAQAKWAQQQEQSAIQLRGQPLPDEDALTLGLPLGTRKLPEDIPKWREEAQKYRQVQQAMQIARQTAGEKIIGPGQQLIQTMPEEQQPPGAPVAMPSAAAPGKPAIPMEPMNVPGQAAAAPAATAAPGAPAAAPRVRVLASGGMPEPTGELGVYLRAKLAATGHTYQSAMRDDPGLISDLTARYKVETADPEMRAASLAQKNAALATADLAQTMKQIQIGQMPTKEQATRIAGQILNHELAPSQIAEIRGRSNGALGLMIEDAIAKKDPHFSWQQADADYTYSKSPALQSTLRYMDAAIGSMGRLQTAADTLNNGNIRSINSLVKLGKNQFNNVDLKRFQTDVTLVGDEIAKILQGGGTGSGTSDAKMRQAQEIFKDTDSPRAIATALREVQSIIGYRRQAMSRGTPYEGVGVEAPAAAGGGAAAHKISINGKEYTYNGTGATDDLKNYTPVVK